MQKMKKMLVAITATWCGACHNISDRLNTAISRSNNGTRIDEKMLGKFNNSLKASIEPPHFPYFIVINENAKVIKVLKDMEEVESFLAPLPSNSMASLTNSGNNNGRNNVNAGNNNNNNNNSNNSNNSKKINNSRMNVVMNSINKSVEKSFLPSTVNNANNQKSNIINQNSISETITEEPMEMESVGINGVAKGPSQSIVNANSMKMATPPNQALDALEVSATEELTETPAEKPAQVGGCLYAGLSKTAYDLAAPAVLLGIAAATLKRKGRKTRRGRKTRK
jgi:hypothetical protein